MRLFEVEDNFLVDLTTVLRNILGRADDTDSPVVLTYKAVSNLLGNMGYGEMTYDQFDKLASGDSPLAPGKGLITDYDENSITLSTKNAEPEQPAGMNTDSDAGKSVDQMAHNAVQDLTS
jgi:hypothetical protein